jgi:hypothetical protein
MTTFFPAERIQEALHENTPGQTFHLSFTRACKLIDPQGRTRIMEGAKFDINLYEQVRLDEDQFSITISLPNEAFPYTMARSLAGIIGMQAR